MPLRTKFFTISLLWIAIGISVCIGTQNLVVRIVLVLVAIGVTLHIIYIRARKQG